MTKLTFLLFLTAPLVSYAQPCEPSTQVRDALKDTKRESGSSVDRTAAIRTVLQGFPNDVWVHRAYQDTFRQGPVYRQPVIDEYKALLSKHAGDPEYLYLYGRTLVGTRTPEAISTFDQALAKDPKYAPAHLSLVEIYRAPNFKDPDKALTNLETWMDACPTQFEGFHYLERMDNSRFTRRSVARMRTLIESRTDATALGYYRNLWTLEFQMHPAPEYPQVKENIRKDLARLREMDGGDKPFLASTLREGYKLVDDKEGLQWVAEKFPATSANGPNAAMEAYQEWQESHPYPQFKPGEKINQDASQTRNKALLEASAEWIRKWPDDNFAWSQRLMALQMNRDTPDAEVDRVAEGLRKTSKPVPNGSTTAFQLASLYLQRNMHLSEIPEMVKKGLEDLDKSPAFPSSDLYPPPSGMSMQSMRLMNRTQGLNTLVDVYLKTDHPDKALEGLADLRKTLDETKPNDSAKDFEKQNWARQDGTYWDKMGQVADKQGRKLDALTYYQNEIRGTPSPGNQAGLKRKAKVLWTDLGGTDSAWDAWLARIEPAKAVTTASIRTEWEKMNKPLPELDLTDMAGKTWRLADIKGKTTLINLWATWCGPCKMELPHLQKLYDKLKDRPDVRIITLNTDDNPGLIESFLKENKYTFPVLPARAYVDKLVPSLSIPRNWIVDTQAVLKLESIGFGGSDKWLENMTETIEKAK
ncbi:MAG: redoxin domain-containing protein [Bryobacteraceae bacterium]